MSERALGLSILVFMLCCLAIELMYFILTGDALFFYLAAFTFILIMYVIYSLITG